MIEISLVSALFNEKQSVERLLEELDKVFRNADHSYELIIVDDGSNDGSIDVLKCHVGLIPNLRILELHKNKGQVVALGAGMSIARGNWVIMMDADLQHDPAFVSKFISLSEDGYDLIASYRERREEKVLRKLVTAIGNRVNRYLIGVDIKDFGSAFRMIHSDVLKSITDANGYVHYNTPAIYMNARNRTEIPITQHQRPYGSSKWSLLDFILFNMDIVTVSPRLTQILLYMSGLGGLIGVTLYIMHIFGIFPDVSAISAPVSIAFTSFILAVLAIVWREVIELKKIVRNQPPFLIRTIWSDSVAECDCPVQNPGDARNSGNKRVKK